MSRRAEPNEPVLLRERSAQTREGRRRPMVRDGFWAALRGRFHPVHDIGSYRPEWRTSRRGVDEFHGRPRNGTVS